MAFMVGMVGNGYHRGLPVVFSVRSSLETESNGKYRLGTIRNSIRRGGSVSAAGGGAEAIAKRQAVMKSIGAHVGGLKGALKANNGKAVAMHAGAINGLAKVLVGFFPKGSGPEAGVKTRALAKIWQDWDNFKKHARIGL